MAVCQPSPCIKFQHHTPGATLRNSLLWPGSSVWMRASWYTTKYQYWSDNTSGRGKTQTTFPGLCFLWLYTRWEPKLERERPSTSTTEHNTNYTVLNAGWNIPDSGSHTNTGFPNSKVEKEFWQRQRKLSQASLPACVVTLPIHSLPAPTTVYLLPT